jgi:two-component system chemotaxis sensor kinase CheA
MAVTGEMAELLQDFLVESGDLLDQVDQRLIELEASPSDKALLNAIFRGFHTIKGGAGFLEAAAMVDLCHRTETLFDQLRSEQRALDAEMLDAILGATAQVKRMMDQMRAGEAPSAAPPALLAALDDFAAGRRPPPAGRADAPVPTPVAPPDWDALRAALLPGTPAAPPAAVAARQPATPRGAEPARASTAESTLRVDTQRFDQILNLSGEIGLVKNRLQCLRGALADGGDDARRGLEEALGRLDTLVADLQSAVMKARMQPVGRVFQKYNRLARDVARTLGKDLELVIDGAATEVDKTILEELNEPLVHLVRNAVDHGLETPAERVAAGKPARGTIRLSARQVGDHIIVEVGDDGRGMRPDFIRQKALQKGLLSAAQAGALDDRASLNLVFLPGFSTRTEISAVSGRGVGMDVVRINIERLKGRVELDSQPGAGSRVIIALPLTLAILPVLMMKQDGQTYALPLSAVREIVSLDPARVQSVAGAPSLVVRGEILPVIALADLLGRAGGAAPRVGVVAHCDGRGYVLAVDGFVGQDEVMIKTLEGLKPRGVAGATLSGEGVLVLVLEMRELLEGRL